MNFGQTISCQYYCSFAFVLKNHPRHVENNLIKSNYRIPKWPINGKILSQTILSKLRTLSFIKLEFKAPGEGGGVCGEGGVSTHIVKFT
jgi:hypothetical protein